MGGRVVFADDRADARGVSQRAFALRQPSGRCRRRCRQSRRSRSSPAPAGQSTPRMWTRSVASRQRRSAQGYDGIVRRLPMPWRCCLRRWTRCQMPGAADGRLRLPGCSSRPCAGRRAVRAVCGGGTGAIAGNARVMTSTTVVNTNKMARTCCVVGIHSVHSMDSSASKARNRSVPSGASSKSSSSRQASPARNRFANGCRDKQGLREDGRGWLQGVQQGQQGRRGSTLFGERDQVKHGAVFGHARQYSIGRKSRCAAAWRFGADESRGCPFAC